MDIIFKSFIKNKYTLVEYIDIILVNLSLFNGLNILLNFQVYTKIINEYLNFIDTKINFEETGINLEEEISVEIILDLFKKDNKNDLVFIQSLVVLKYESLKDIINKYNMLEISKALNNIFIKITNGIDISPKINIDKAIMIFREELQNLNSKDNKKKKKKRKRNKNKQNNINSNIINIRQEKDEKNFEVMDKGEKEQANKIKENKSKISNSYQTKTEEFNDIIEINQKMIKLIKKGIF